MNFTSIMYVLGIDCFRRFIE